MKIISINLRNVWHLLNQQNNNNILKNIISIIKSKSPKYILFRSKYEFERKTGLLSRKFPTNPPKEKLPFLEEWRMSSTHYLFDNKEDIKVLKSKNIELSESICRILNGEIQFFSHDWKRLGLNWDYVTNPINGYKYKVNQHWTKVNDFDENAGDIKFVWEPSRFCWLYQIVRNDYHNDDDHAEFVIGRILDWIEKNPLNCGPNYKCSQETSLRVLNWLFALNFYKNSEALTEERWNRIVISIFWQVDHVYKNINFSRIAVRNNHAITETLTLYLVGLLFPSFPHANKWKKDGKRWFEQEIEYQFEPDGTYIQQSMNYQRVVTQLLTLGIALAEKNGERFSNVVYQRAYANLNFLYQCQDLKTGMLPNYGANDGALFFQLSDNDYCDYRPQLDALHQMLTGQKLYNDFFEDIQWYGIELGKEHLFAPIQRKQGMITFNNGGYYIVRYQDNMVFIRCGSFKGKMTTDQMHIDVWHNGENVLMDGGSYMYNTDDKARIYFAGTESHNAVMLGNEGQMKKGPRFMWFYPSRILEATMVESKDGYVFEGRIETFRALADGVKWKREIHISKDLNNIKVIDEVLEKPQSLQMRQIWHTVSNGVEITSDGIADEKEGFYSRYYSWKQTNKQKEFLTYGNLVTTIIKITKQ